MRPDLILSDYNLRGSINGVETIKGRVIVSAGGSSGVLTYRGRDYP
jgi:hypothetical protein